MRKYHDVPLPTRQKWHAQSRLYERYDIMMLDREYDELCQIAGDPQRRHMLYKQPDQREVQAIQVRDWWIACVYDPRTRSILTFLPPRDLKKFNFRPPSNAA